MPNIHAMKNVVTVYKSIFRTKSANGTIFAIIK